MVDYSKWDNLSELEEDDDTVVKDHHEEKSFYEVLHLANKMKQEADSLMTSMDSIQGDDDAGGIFTGNGESTTDRTHSSDQSMKYLLALQKYENILQFLDTSSIVKHDHISKTSSDSNNGPNLVRVSCHMNIVCCLAKLDRWQEVIEKCDRLAASITDSYDKCDHLTFLFTSQDKIRLQYFLSWALIELLEKETDKASNTARDLFRRCKLEVDTMKEILSSTNASESPDIDQMNEYNRLFTKIERFRPNALATDQSSEDRAMSDVLETAWENIRSKRYEEALKLLSIPIESTALRHDDKAATNCHLLLAKLLQGQAKAYLGLKEYFKAGQAFQRSAEQYLKEGLEYSPIASSLLLQAGNSWQKSENHHEAVKCFADAVRLLEGTDSNQSDQVLLLAIARAEKADCLVSIHNRIASTDTRELAVMSEAVRLHAAAQDVFIALRTPKISFQADYSLDSCGVRLLWSLRSMARGYFLSHQIKEAITTIDKLLQEIETMCSNISQSDSIESPNLSTIIHRYHADILIEKGDYVRRLQTNKDQSAIRMICSIYLEAAELYDSIEAFDSSYKTYEMAAKIWMDLANVSPYEIINVISPDHDREETLEAAEQASDSWRLSGRSADRHINRLDPSNTSWGIWKANYVISSYHAGICALRFDYDTARRFFESSEAGAKDYLSVPHLDEKNRRDMDVLLGDIAFHLGHCYLRLGEYKNALDEMSQCHGQFESLRDDSSVDPQIYKSRMRQICSMKVIALAASHKASEAERELQSLRQYYANPSSELEYEISRLREIIRRHNPPKPAIISTEFNPIQVANRSSASPISRSDMQNIRQKAQKEQTITVSTVYQSIVGIIYRRCYSVLRNLFGKRQQSIAAPRRSASKDWDYNVILAYFILATAASIALAISVPIIVYLLDLQ